LEAGDLHPIFTAVQYVTSKERKNPAAEEDTSADTLKTSRYVPFS
jgi:hypothetical protein